MLVSTNVLTPFSYAQDGLSEVISENKVETVDESLWEAGKITEISEEISELNSERKWELGQENQDSETPEDVLPNVQDDVETPTSDETEKIDIESDEEALLVEETPKSEIEDEDLQWNEVEDDFLLQKEDETIIIQAQPWTTTTLLSWFEFNVAIKNLAGQSVSYYTTDNTTIQQIIQWTWNTIPLWVVTWELSVENSDYPVYARFTWWIIYYYTEAEKIYMNPNSSHMFYGMKWLTWLDLSNWNTSNVTNMTYIFNSCSNLNEINLDGRDFSNMSQCPTQPFGNTSLKKLSARWWKLPSNFNNMINWFWWSIEEIDATDWDLENTTNISYMFGNSKIKNIKWLNTRKNTSNVTNMEGMFYGIGLTWLDLSGWDTSNVTKMWNMFSSALEEINLNGWDFRNVVSDLPMRRASNIKKFEMENTKFSGSMSNAFKWLTSLEEVNLSWADVSSVTNMSNVFSYCENLKKVNLQWWGTNDVSDMSHMFENCSSLKKLDLSDLYTKNVTDMSNMFYGCSWLTSLDLSAWDTSNVTNMGNMFFNCSSVTELDLSSWDTSNVSNLGAMFYWCSSLTKLDLSGWDTSNVTNIDVMFYTSWWSRYSWIFWWCNLLEELNLSGWDFRKINNSALMMAVMWWTPQSLKKLNMVNTKYTWNAQYAFGWLNKLEEINLSWADVSNVTSMNAMFNWDSNLIWLDLSSWDTSNVTNMWSMFGWCSSLTWLDLSSFNTSNVMSVWFMFQNCSKLEDLNLDNRVINNSSSTIGWMFGWASNLKNVSMRNWTIPENFTSAIWCRASSLCATDLESIDVSNWNLSGTKNLYWLFWDLNAKEIKWLNTWDTSNVTNMGNMFEGCINITWLNLSNFDTSNVNNMWSMFGWCSKLEEINLSGWDFRNISNASLMMNITAWWIPSLTKLNMTNTKYTWNATYAFGWLNKLEELNLNWADTSNVTSMNAMFNWDSNLKILHLSSFDTSNVKDMNKMFYNTPNLKTIYASENFVTTALSWDNSSKDMFSWTTSVVWWNWTKFDSNYIDEEYAKIDKVWQTWYFTDKFLITVKFINTLDWTETYATFAKWQKLTPPYVDKYHVVWWYLDEEMKQTIDLNKWVDSYSEIYVKYERNGSSGWWGWGWSSKKTDKDTHWSAEDSQKNTQDDKNTENVIQSETKWSEESSNTPVDSSADKSASEWQEILSPSDSPSSAGQVSFTKEQKDAYTFAKENWITTKDTIQSAQMNGKLTRIAMAKMLSQYAINVLWKEPDVSKWVVKFNDVTLKKDADYDNWVTLAYQLWIMWQNMPWNKFRPNDEVTRAEFATALSRMAYWTSDGEYEATSKYYIHHMEKLVKEWIITKDDPNMKELRGYVMIMLMRSAES